MKRVLSFILVLSMILGSIGMAFAAPSEANQSAIDKMVELGFVQGDEGGLRLDETITRAELAVIATRMAGLEDVALKSNYQGGFSDVTPDMWDNPVMNGAINVAAGQGLVKGYPDGTFQPGNDITNAEAITLMVRMVVSAEEAAKLDAGVWPAAYITKAAELGLLEGANIANYQAAAVREAVFVIGYNAHSIRVEEDYYVVKALVLENNRVERIGKGEVVVEVIKEVQRADFAEESRKDQGDQLRLDIPAELGDVENLLGKVVDISLDKDEKVAKLAVDNTYQYLDGAVKAEEAKLTVGRTAYTVTLDERYDKKEDRVFRTYLNNDALSYKDFYQDPTREKGSRPAEDFEADYARVTIKNGKVIFIDAYNFDDISPVKEVKKDGEEVFVYNDARDGGVKKYELKASDRVLAINEGKISTATIEDIEVSDVVHEYDGGYIVRKDAAVSGTFEKVSEDRNGVFVHVDDEKYKVLKDDYKQPVYSYDSEDFYTLNADKAADVLREFRGEKVTALLDLADNLQYIGSDIELGEFVAIITNIVGRDVRVLKQQGTKAEYSATLDTKYETSDTGHARLNNFEIGDLVYLSVDGDNIDRMVRIQSETDAVKVNQLTAKDIELSAADAENQTDFRILSGTNIFVKIGNAYEVRTAKEVADAFKDDNDAEAYVVSGKIFANGLDKFARRDVYTIRDDEAHTIVFTKLNIKSDLDTEVVKFDGYADRQETEVNVVYADGAKDTLFVPRAQRSKVPSNLRSGDIIEIKVTKDDKKDLMEASVLITNSTKDNVFKVASYDRFGNLVLEDANGEKSDELYVTSDTVVFGNLSRAKRVSYSLEKDSSGNETNYVRTILVRKDNDPLATFDETGSIGGALTFDAYLGAGKVRLGGRVYDVEGAIKEFIEENEDVLEKGVQLAVNVVDGKVTRLVGLVVNAKDIIINGAITTPAAGKVEVRGNVVVNGNNVTLKDMEITGTVYKYAETLTLTDVNADVVVVEVGGGTTLNLTDSTKVGTVTVNVAEKIAVGANAEVEKEIVVNAEAKGTKIEGSGTIKKVVVKAADVEVPEDVTVEVDESVKPEITDASVTDVVYDEGKYKVTFTVKTKNATNVDVESDEVESDVDVEFENNIATFVITAEEPKEFDVKVTAIYKVGEAIEKSEAKTIKVKEADFPAKK